MWQWINFWRRKGESQRQLPAPLPQATLGQPPVPALLEAVNETAAGEIVTTAPHVVVVDPAKAPPDNLIVLSDRSSLPNRSDRNLLSPGQPVIESFPTAQTDRAWYFRHGAYAGSDWNRSRLVIRGDATPTAGNSAFALRTSSR